MRPTDENRYRGSGSAGASSGGPPIGVDLTIVIPCLNEEQNIDRILGAVRAIIRVQPFTSEIIVVDDMSDDQTVELARAWAKGAGADCRVSIVQRPLRRRGYGAVVRYGVAYGVGRYCIFVSADAVDPIQLIPLLYEKLESGCLLAQCSRYLKSDDSETIPFKYKFFQFFFRLGVRIALGQYIADSTYAFKMFRRREMLGVGLAQNRFSISPEITFKSVLMGGPIAYIPGAQGTRERGVSKFVFSKEGFGFSYCLLRAFLHRYKVAYWF